MEERCVERKRVAGRKGKIKRLGAKLGVWEVGGSSYASKVNMMTLQLAKVVLFLVICKWEGKGLHAERSKPWRNW